MVAALSATEGGVNLRPAILSVSRGGSQEDRPAALAADVPVSRSIKSLDVRRLSGGRGYSDHQKGRFRYKPEVNDDDHDIGGVH